MSDPSAPSELEKRSTETTASTPLKFSVLRLALAFAIAGVSDVIGAFASVAPPIGWVVDVVTAALLFVVLGWQWLLLPGLVLEAIPGIGVVPFWRLGQRLDSAEASHLAIRPVSFCEGFRMPAA